jgi:hypothetical protein
MTQYRIVCIKQHPFDQPHSHEHVIQVGTGTLLGKPEHLWTMRELFSAMDRGSEFYTYGEQSKKVAGVQKFRCPHCSYDSIRSAPEAVKDNNLNQLPSVETVAN